MPLVPNLFFVLVTLSTLYYWVESAPFLPLGYILLERQQRDLNPDEDIHVHGYMLACAHGHELIVTTSKNAAFWKHPFSVVTVAAVPSFRCTAEGGWEKSADVWLPLFTQRTCITQNGLFTHPAITEKSSSCVTKRMPLQYLLSFRSTSLLQRFWVFSSHNALEPAACRVQATGGVFFQSFLLLVKDIRAEKWVWTAKWGDTHYKTHENWRGRQIQVTTGCVRPIC